MGYKVETIIEKVKAKVAEADPDPSKRTILTSFEFIITSGGKEVKRYVIDLKSLTVYEGKAKEKADVLVTVDDDVLEKLLTLAVTVDDSIKAGTLKVEGDDQAIPNMKKLTQKLRE